MIIVAVLGDCFKGCNSLLFEVSNDFKLFPAYKVYFLDS